MKNPLRFLLAVFKPMLEFAIETEARIAARWVASAHKRLRQVQWGLPPQPEHFDHHIDLYQQWPATRNPMWLERGVFGALAMREGAALLELACGDGFYARHFYSLRCRTVIACDFDPAALRAARRKNAAPNITYVLADIRTAMPEGTFDHIVWDAAIEHFTPTEIEQIMRAIRVRLVPEGVLSGYTIVERDHGVKSLSHREYEFKSKEDLRRFLAPHFARVTVFETKHPGRHNLYFWASDGVLPFRPEWPQMCGQGGAGR